MVYLTYEQNQNRNHICNLIHQVSIPFPRRAKVSDRIQTLRKGRCLYLHHRQAFVLYD